MFRREIEIQQIGKGAMLYAVLPNARVHYTDCILQNDKSTSTFYLNKKIEWSSIYLMHLHILF